MRFGAPLFAAVGDGGHRRVCICGDGPGAAVRAVPLLRRPADVGLWHRRAAAEGHAAHALRARPRARVPRERLEHRCRRAAHARCDRGRRRCALLGAALGKFALPAMLCAGVLGGMAWAAIPAFLRTRFNTSEILVSLMLVYIAQLLLVYLLHGAWRDPEGFNFPQSKVFEDSQILPTLAEGMRANVAFILALALAAISWIFSSRTFAGYRMLVAGLAPAAASYAGFSEKRNIWLALLIGGGAAGLAGISEVAGPIGRLQLSISPGYGFAAIIVAFVGRLHPLGIVLASLLMSLLYLGGESVQLSLQLPSAVTGLFQGTLLFYLLAADLFVGIPAARDGRALRRSRVTRPQTEAVP